MEFKKLTKDVEIPVLGIGTWKMGGRATPEMEHDEEEIRAIKTAIKLGLTHIDTAEKYGGGHAEELVGEAIKNVEQESLFITTKVSPSNLAYADVFRSAQKSLQRLGTGYIDLYLIHAPNPLIPIKETMSAMDKLVEQGLVRFVGVSNFSVNELKDAQNHSGYKIVANQIEYNLFVRNKGQFTECMESEIVPYCQANDIMVIAYRPLSGGRITQFRINVLEELSKKYQKTSAQIVLNWLISQKKVITIFKASKIEHLKENLGCLGWKLSEEDRLKLDKLRSE